jgi:hypothetical protein
MEGDLWTTHWGTSVRVRRWKQSGFSQLALGLQFRIKLLRLLSTQRFMNVIFFCNVSFITTKSKDKTRAHQNAELWRSSSSHYRRVLTQIVHFLNAIHGRWTKITDRKLGEIREDCKIQRASCFAEKTYTAVRSIQGVWVTTDYSLRWHSVINSLKRKRIFFI